MMLNRSTKTEVKGQAVLEIFYAEESNNLIGREDFGAKTQEPDC